MFIPPVSVGSGESAESSRLPAEYPTSEQQNGVSSVSVSPVLELSEFLNKLPESSFVASTTSAENGIESAIVKKKAVEESVKSTEENVCCFMKSTIVFQLIIKNFRTT